MKTSVIIPVFNEEKYIANCLTHLVNQTIKPDEVIVVDNNCVDKTIDIVKKFKNKLSIKIIKEKRQGIIFARNTGFNNAKGDIYIRTDADSQHQKNWIERIKKNFEHNKKIDGLTGPVVFFDLPLKSPVYSKILIYIFKLITGTFPFWGPQMIITKNGWRKVVNKLCIDEKKVHEDFDLAIHFFKSSLKIYYDSKLIAYVSGRRIKKNPFSFFVEYPWRLIKMILSHRKIKNYLLCL
jgi:glycosyltransferase involved in cell wall biosynthesis